MSRAEWDPLRELSKVQERMNRLFETALGRTDFDAGGGIDTWTPIADVHEADSCLVLSLELPGVDQKDIELRVEGDELIVEGERHMNPESPKGEQFHRVERSYGKFSRRFAMPSTVNRDAVEAAYRNGVLQITLLKKSSKQPGPIRVSIT